MESENICVCVWIIIIFIHVRKERDIKKTYKKI